MKVCSRLAAKLRRIADVADCNIAASRVSPSSHQCDLLLLRRQIAEFVMEVAESALSTSGFVAPFVAHYFVQISNIHSFSVLLGYLLTLIPRSMLRPSPCGFHRYSGLVPDSPP